MARFFSADLHFGHRNVISYCERPFTDLEHMTEGLIFNWNRVVSSHDEVWILGDFSFYNSTKTAAILSRLNGRKNLVRGNHDDVKTDEKAWRLGYTLFVSKARVALSDGTEVNLSHYPYVGDSTETDRFLDRRLPDDGSWLLHGHVHREWKIRVPQINVGVDVWDYKPVSEAQILDLISVANDMNPSPLDVVRHYKTP